MCIRRHGTGYRSQQLGGLPCLVLANASASMFLMTIPRITGQGTGGMWLKLCNSKMIKIAVEQIQGAMLSLVVRSTCAACFARSWS